MLRRGAWRPTKAHEYIFLLTKSDRYFCDGKAVREVYISNPPLGNTWDERKQRPINDGREKINLRSDNFRSPGGFTQTNSGRNRRTVWQIATQPYIGAHFATFPEALVEPCVKAATSERGCCPVCGSQWARVVERETKHRTELPSDDPRYRPARYPAAFERYNQLEVGDRLNLEKIPRQKMDTLPIQERQSSDREVELGFSKEVAVREANRCLQCHLFTIFDRTKCILCGGCVDICPKSSFRMARLDEIQGDENLSAYVKSLYEFSIEEAERLRLATVMIKDESRCIQCGLCAKRCPTGAITMEMYHRESPFYREETQDGEREIINDQAPITR